jgi:flagella basal body P-ring formation protein FlgA
LGTVLDDSDLLGFALRRSLKPGQPVRERDVQKPVIVAKGSMVMLVYRTAAMVLSAGGRALEDGAMGATIRVLNSHSKLVVEAVVEGGSIVSVSLMPRLAMN